ncbi:MAG TPA: hypothetical protein VN028_01890, partial [Rhodocyclaceae bacterium]|nr:hypothetical protein [Rhodocyclaceae bacterium]
MPRAWRTLVTSFPGKEDGRKVVKFAFIVDPLDKLKAYKDSSVAMMREAAQRG